jgi:hypothetical protein
LTTPLELTADSYHQPPPEIVIPNFTARCDTSNHLLGQWVACTIDKTNVPFYQPNITWAGAPNDWAVAFAVKAADVGLHYVFTGTLSLVFWSEFT